MVIAAVMFGDVGKVVHVVVAVQEHRVFPMFPFVFNDLHEVALQLFYGEVQIGVEVVPDKHVDAVVVNEAFPCVPSVNVANDVVGGHGLRCLIMVAKIAVFQNRMCCCLVKRGPVAYEILVGRSSCDNIVAQFKKNEKTDR